MIARLGSKARSGEKLRFPLELRPARARRRISEAPSHATHVRHNPCTRWMNTPQISGVRELGAGGRQRRCAQRGLRPSLALDGARIDSARCGRGVAPLAVQLHRYHSPSRTPNAPDSAPNSFFTGPTSTGSSSCCGSVAFCASSSFT
ncbi:MAG TPA: hypothetical protein VJU61_23105, partial [Polyangiaceae bacterium]|nr:hypothetical protein [Polyangiaceae bacterium]